MTPEENKHELFIIFGKLVELSGRGATLRLAEKIGTPRTHMYKILSPLGNPSIETVCKMAHAFGLKVTLTVGHKGVVGMEEK